MIARVLEFTPRRASLEARGVAQEETIVIDSPVGPLTLAARGGKLTRLQFARGEARNVRANPAPTRSANPVLREAARQLAEHFTGARTRFELPLAPEGTDFQRAVWRALREIPYGETRSYGAIAAAVGKPQAARAVGGANNQNPIAIVIPCHRVIGANGALVGFGGGLDIKRALLALESRAGG